MIIWCRSYLRSMQDFRRQGTNIIFMDETWVYIGHATSKVRKDKTIETPRDAYI